MGITALECFGYAASIVVVISFGLKDMFKLRVVSIIGCTLFVIYGLMFENVREGLPVILTNLAIICLNSFFLFRMAKDKKREIPS
jgi:hypothetical protein